MALRISKLQLERIQQHGARDYPSECCGALLGTEVNGTKEVKDVAPLRNVRHDPDRAEELLPLTVPERESERNRFLIDPKDLLKVEKEARERGLDLIGYYHSHPDHPARPSGYDRDHAFPWYSYVIIAVERGAPGQYTSWTLREDRSEFNEEPIEVTEGSPRGKAPNEQ
ncbi:MAG: M67 family metallopeptidase [Terriglobia bacterium]